DDSEFLRGCLRVVGNHRFEAESAAYGVKRAADSVLSMERDRASAKPASAGNTPSGSAPGSAMSSSNSPDPLSPASKRSLHRQRGSPVTGLSYAGVAWAQEHQYQNPNQCELLRRSDNADFVSGCKWVANKAAGNFVRRMENPVIESLGAHDRF